MKKMGSHVRLVVPSLVVVAAVLAVACGDDPVGTDPGEDGGSGDGGGSSSSSSSSSSGSSSGGRDAGDGGGSSSGGSTDAGDGGGSSSGGDADAAPATYAVGGSVTGLTGTGLVLQLNGGPDLAVAGAAFTFPTKVASGAAYAVTVKTQPSAPAQTCTVANGSGTVGAADVTNVAITCTTTTYTIGGTITGLVGTVVLQNNAGDDLTRTADGAFTFATGVAPAGAYAVTVKTHPANQICAVAAGTGNAAANVTNVAVTCAAPTTCKSIKAANPAAADGDYQLDPDGAGPLPAVTAYCDMTTDGGGYTYVAVTGGISTTNKDQPNSCDAMGLKMVIPRTLAHAQALYAKYGASYFQTVPGVYGVAAGNYTGCAMNSGDAVCAANWKAIDGGEWFIRSVPYSEPNGDYVPGCWLSGTWQTFDAQGFRVNDGNCGYATGGNYICSDNGK